MTIRVYTVGPDGKRQTVRPLREIKPARTIPAVYRNYPPCKCSACRVRRTYAVFLMHLVDCVECGLGRTQCPRAQALYRSYIVARSQAPTPARSLSGHPH